jgi:tRNA modification GTPase
MTTAEIASSLHKLDASLSDLLSRSQRGRVIKDGLRTVLIGRPNAGKSSLLNALLQEDRAIVTDMPGTTRDTIEETIRIGGVPLVLMDTAGLRDAENQVEAIGIEKARQSMNQADLILAVIDSSKKLSDEDINILHSIDGRRAIVILNKYDMPQEISEEDIYRYVDRSIPVVSISARYGSGIDQLEALLQEMTNTQDLEAGRQLFLTNLRHVDLAEKALQAVRRAIDGCEDHMPPECIAVDLTEAFDTLGEITGEHVDDELINSIFQNFCVGK